jgi:hypothetical protein
MLENIVSDWKGLDQPACQERWKRCKKKRRKKNSDANVMYIQYVCPCVSYSVVGLFTCTLVRSHPDSNEGDECETRSIWDKQQDTKRGLTTQNARGVEGQKETQSKPGSRP